MKIRRLKQRGDTLVEVLLATVILSVVISSAYTLANRATRVNQAAFERTQMSNILQEQIELIRAARNEGTNWGAVLSQSNSAGSYDCQAQDLGNPGWGAPSPEAFHMVDDGGNIRPEIGARPDGEVTVFDGHVWVSKVDNGSYVDFTAYGCWLAQGSDANNFAGITIRLQKASS